MSGQNLTDSPSSAFAVIDDVLRDRADVLIAIRRDLHAHPETAWQEERTSGVVEQVLSEAGLRTRRFAGTGLICDLPGVDTSRIVALRADLDALPVTEETGLPYSSTIPDASHACGHDVHTTSVLGATFALAELSRRGELPTTVRLVFQPAEEVQPGGAEAAIEAGVLEGVEQIYALHCDPKVEVGTIGSRVGSITSASTRFRSRCALTAGTPPART